MDIEELMIATLKISEQKELEFMGQPKLYTCNDLVDPKSLFGEIMNTGELCVCANDDNVATFLLYLIKGVFNHGDSRFDWFTKQLSGCFNFEYDDLNPEDAFNLWVKEFSKTVSIKKHNITQPIIINNGKHTVTLTPSTCDIWTLPRIRRQFVD